LRLTALKETEAAGKCSDLIDGLWNSGIEGLPDTQCQTIGSGNSTIPNPLIAQFSAHAARWTFWRAVKQFEIAEYQRNRRRSKKLQMQGA
jgi:hypothetical protein